MHYAGVGTAIAKLQNDNRNTDSLPFEVRLNQRRKTMLWTILAVLVVLWLLGFIGGVGGSLIHALLVIAAVVLLIQIFTGRRVAV